MKYIDAEKLKALIDEKWRELADKNVKAGGGKWDAEISTYLSVLRLITSLQQEQPENEEKIMNFFDALGDCGFSQHDILLLKSIWKEAGCPLPKPQIADASKMEQPEVNLEQEVDSYIENERYFPDDERHIVLEIARRFYELGKARKEDTK